MIPAARTTWIANAHRDDVIGKEQCDKLRQCIMNIDSAKNVGELVEPTVAH